MATSDVSGARLGYSWTVEKVAISEIVVTGVLLIKVSIWYVMVGVTIYCKNHLNAAIALFLEMCT